MAAIRRVRGTPVLGTRYQPICGPGQNGPPARVARVLSISGSSEDHSALRHILRDPWWRISVASDCREALDRLTQDRVAIVVCESNLPDGSWKDILAHFPDYPEEPILIVTSRRPDGYLWSEVLNLGGYDVLTKPFDDLEVHRVLVNAWARKTTTVRAMAAGA